MKTAFYKNERKVFIGESSPVYPKSNEVKVSISYCGICGTDLHIFHGKMDERVGKEAIIGHECSGLIEEIGSDVKGYAIGDKVVIRPLKSCGECKACKMGLSHICYNLKFMGIDTPGAFRESWTVDASLIHKLPDDMDMQLGALIEPLAVACHDVKRGVVGKGDKVVVIGGGPIGLLIGMVAKHDGADVMISEINPFRIAKANSLGINTVNPRERDLTEFVDDWTLGEGADVCFEVSATKSGAQMMTQITRPRGKIVVVGIFSIPPEINLKQCFLRELEIYGARVYESEDFETAIKIASTGDLALMEIVTGVYELDDLQKAFEALSENSDEMKILVRCS